MGYIEEGIEYLYEALKLVKTGHPFSRCILHLLAADLLDCFRDSGTDKDIADAIKHYRTSISLMPEGNPEISFILSKFARCLHILFSRTGDAAHLEESISLYRSAVEYPFCGVHDRLRAAYNWAATAHTTRHSSALTAYRKALSLLQRAIDLGPTVQTRHEYISGQDIEHFRGLPMVAASYAIESVPMRKPLRCSNKGERSCGPVCAVFAPHSITFAAPTNL